MSDTMTAPAASRPSGATATAFPWWLLLIQGLAALVIGGLLLAYPAKTTVTLVYFLGWWWLITGIFELGSLFVSREMWGWKVLSGLLGIIAGGYIIEQRIAGAIIVVGTLTLLLGINGIIIGVVDIVKAFQGAGWGKGIVGFLSLIFGAIIAFNFVEFSTVMPWVVAIIAIGFGLAAIVMSFQVRRATA